MLRDQEGNPLIHFTYSDDVLWPAMADGDGYSLVPVDLNPTGNPVDPDYWKGSAGLGGSPFHDEPFPQNDHPEENHPDDIWIYPNPTSGELHVEVPVVGENENVMFRLYDSKGQLILQYDHLPNGHSYLDGLNLSQGIYIIRIDAGNQIYTRKLIYQ